MTTMAKDYYQILGVPRVATEDEIKRAYRKLAMDCHPDRNPGKEAWANEKFKEINEAYGVLGNPDKRRQYDTFGTTGDIADVFGSAGTRTTFEDLVREFGSAGLGLGFLEEIFGGILNRSGGSFSFTVSGHPYGDIRFGSYPFKTAWMGIKQDVKYELRIAASEAKKGTTKLLRRKGKTLEVKIPPGTKSGSVLKLNDACRVTDGHPGDILVHVKVKSVIRDGILWIAKKFA